MIEINKNPNEFPAIKGNGKNCLGVNFFFNDSMARKGKLKIIVPTKNT